jgi:hypothetical protein
MSNTLIKKLEKLIKESENKESITFNQEFTLPFEIGKEYFIRTVTYHLTGRVKDIVGKFLVLEDCAWIADSGRFNEFFKTPSSSLEVEPFGQRDVFVNSDSITDATERAVLLEVIDNE